MKIQSTDPQPPTRPRHFFLRRPLLLLLLLLIR